MKKTVIFISLFLLVFLGTSPLTHGAGFLIYEHGAAAMAMGGAFVAVANDATAIFHNPAGLVWLEGTQISLGTTLITAAGSLSLPNWPDPTFQTIDRERQWFYPSTFYISHKINDRIVAGFGFFNAYGLGQKWPEDYPLRYIATRDDMKTFFFNPTLAFKLSDDLSVGAGVSYVYSTLAFDLVEPFFLIPASFPLDVPGALEANGSGWGLNAGVLYKTEDFSLGFNWRGGFEIDYDGDITLDLSNLPLPPSVAISELAGTGKTKFNFPHILGVGVAFNLTRSFMITADVHYVLWSTYDEVTVEIDVPGIEAIYPPGIADKHMEENWEDSFIFRGGLQYMVNENFALRAGLLYDQTPQPVEAMDPILPDAARWAVTGGFGFKSGSFVIDLAYQLELFNDRTSENRSIPFYNPPYAPSNLGQGTYETTAHLIGLSLGFIF